MAMNTSDPITVRINLLGSKIQRTIDRYTYVSWSLPEESTCPPGGFSLKFRPLLAEQGVATMNCPFCASTNVRRSHRRGIREKMSSWLARRPYRCHTCMHRFFSSERYYPEANQYATALPKSQSKTRRQPQVIEGTIIDSHSTLRRAPMPRNRSSLNEK